LHDVTVEQWTNTLYTTKPEDKSIARRERTNLAEIAAGLGSLSAMKVISWFSQDASEQLQAARNSWNLFDVVAAADDTKVVVDSTKNAFRMKLLYMLRPHDFYVIHLVRDGRAVAASAQRRKDVPIRQAARKWRVANRNVEIALKTISSDQVHRLRYEDLCENTEAELKAICRFVSLKYDSDMIELKKREYHEVPGNPMLFRTAETEIVKDERWKSQLTSKEISDFQEVAQQYNAKYGYE
jgi:hypothetical protein